LKQLRFIYLLIALSLINTSPLWAIEGQRIVVMHTNDVHGGIGQRKATFMSREFPPSLGGGASQASIIEVERRRAQENGWGFLLIDDGDIFQGTPVGTKTKGRAVIDYMNRIGYDLLTVGNHDFDMGVDNLRELAKMAKFPFLGANVVDANTGKILSFLKPYLIKDVGGIRLGIIGLCTTETQQMSFPGNIKGVKFLPAAPVMERYIREVKAKGADLVVGSVHLGIPWGVKDAYQRMMEREKRGERRTWMINAMELAHQVPGIDILFCGHIHVGYRHPWEEPSHHTILFQTYAYGSSLGEITLLVDPRTKTLAGYELPTKDGELLTPFSDEFWPNPQIARRIGDEVIQVEKGMKKPIGYTKVNITRGDASNNLMGFVVVDAMRERMGGDFAFINLGGIRREISAGPITTKDIFEVLPFGNQAVIIKMDGRFLKKILEIRVSDDHHGLITSGGEIVYNHNRPDMDRITRFKIGGKTLGPDKIYNVVTTDFIAQGNIGLNILTTIPQDKIYYSGVPVRLMVLEYVKNHSPLSPQVDGRWQRDDNSEMDEELRKSFGKSSS